MSGQTIQGFVAKLNSKNGTKKDGTPWTLWSALIENADGTEFGWVSFGFERPKFNEGDFIQVDVEKKGEYTNAVKGTGSKPKNPPARTTARTGAVGVPESGSGGEGANRQTQIVMQHSQDVAIQLVKLLLDNKALPLTGATTKASEAKRNEEIVAAVDKYTVQFYNDAVTGRLLDVVADAGADRVSTKADGAIPEGDKASGDTKDNEPSSGSAGQAEFDDDKF